MFDSEDILVIGMNKLVEKVNYFNNNYIYNVGTGTRLYGEFNGIDINIAEYADVINNRFDVVIDSVTDIILIPFKEEGN